MFSKASQFLKVRLKRKKLLMISGIIVLLSTGALLSRQQAEATQVVVYKSPYCGCCTEWVEHMRNNGFDVEVHDRNDVGTIKQQMGVPLQLQSCHTARVGDYVIEGHVPASDVKRLLQAEPDVVGLTVPDMPHGSPGMDTGPRKDPYDVLTFTNTGKTSVFANYNQQ